MTYTWLNFCLWVSFGFLTLKSVEMTITEILNYYKIQFPYRDYTMDLFGIKLWGSHAKNVLPKDIYLSIYRHKILHTNEGFLF